MNTQTSLYLDFVRLSAAVFVFLFHATGQRCLGGLFWQLGGYGPEAVIVFFVLSGYVIGYTTDTRETSVKSYTVARVARLYSVALPALLATFALDAIARSVDPGLYTASWDYNPHGKIWQFLAGLSFTNEIWGWHKEIGSDWSYWSLGFEVWYYVLFGVMTFCTGRGRLIGMTALLVFVGPTITVMFPIWLLGLACWRYSDNLRFSPRTGLALFVLSLSVICAYEVWAARHGRLTIDGRPSIMRRELPQDYLIAVLFAVNLLGFRSLSIWLPSTEGKFAAALRWCAGATFTLYLFHEPLIRFLATVNPWPPSSWAGRSLMLGGTAAAVLLAAELTERRKRVWRRGVAGLYDHAQQVFAAAASGLGRRLALRRTPP